MSENQGTPSLPAFVESVINSKLAEVHTSTPGRVVAYYPAKDTADIQPCLQRKFSDGSKEPLPVLRNVKIIWPRTAKASIKFPLAVDDYVLLISVERSIDIFRQRGGIVDPNDTRKHSLSDMIAMPGFWPDSDTIESAADSLEIKNDNSMIRLMPDGKTYIGKKGTTPAEPVILGNVFVEYLNALHEKLDLVLDKLIGGDTALTTSAGSPTAPNPARASELTKIKTDLAALKSDQLDSGAVLSDILFTEKGA